MPKQNQQPKKEVSQSSKHKAPQAESSKYITVISEQQKATNPILHAVYKRIRNMNKKLQSIQALETQPRQKLIQGQIQKIQRKSETIEQIKKNEEFVAFYKSILIENGGKTFDPTELLIKIATLLAVGQYVQKNKGLLFKPQISQEFKNLYESLMKNILNSQKQQSLPQRIDNIVNYMRRFIDNEKDYDICRDFMSYNLNERKIQQVQLQPKDQKNQQSSGKKQPTQPSTIKQVKPKRKNKGKKSWAESSSQQQQQEQTSKPQNVVKQQTNVTENGQKQNTPSHLNDKNILQQKAKQQSKQQSKTENIKEQEFKQHEDLEPSKKTQQKGQYRSHITKDYGNRNYNNPRYRQGYNRGYDRGYNRDRGRIYDKGYRGYDRGYNRSYVQNRDYNQNRGYRGKYYQNSTPYPHKEYEEQDYHKPRNYNRTRYHPAEQGRQNGGKYRRRRDSDSSLSSTPEEIRGYNPRDRQRTNKPTSYVAKNK